VLASWPALGRAGLEAKSSWMIIMRHAAEWPLLTGIIKALAGAVVFDDLGFEETQRCGALRR
jgi:hypothetical protein